MGWFDSEQVDVELAQTITLQPGEEMLYCLACFGETASSHNLRMLHFKSNLRTFDRVGFTGCTFDEKIFEGRGLKGFAAITNVNSSIEHFAVRYAFGLAQNDSNCEGTNLRVSIFKITIDRYMYVR